MAPLDWGGTAFGNLLSVELQRAEDMRRSFAPLRDHDDLQMDAVRMLFEVCAPRDGGEEFNVVNNSTTTGARAESVSR